MIRIFLLTGFLGAGKTTLMQSLLEGYKNHRIGVVVNEFGEVNIDAKLIRSEGMEMAELSNGSIFCACIKDKFVDSLIELSHKDLEYLFIEASGLADPANMGMILDGIAHKTLNKYELLASLCVVDAVHFVDLVELLPALSNQVEFANAVIINKSDLVGQEELVEITARIDELNPGVGVFVTSYCKIDIDAVVAQLKREAAPAKDTSNTYESRPSTFVLRAEGELPREGLEAFLREIAASSYRIKGFVKTAQGDVEVSAVFEEMQINLWAEPISKTELVVISAVGMKMLSMIVAASNKHLEGRLKL